MEFWLACLGVGCYLGATLLALTSLASARPREERATMGLMGAGAAILAIVLAVRGVRTSAIPAFSGFDALTLYALAMTAAYLATVARRPLRGVSSFLAPYLTLALLGALATLAGREPAAAQPPPPQTVWLALHVGLAFASYAFLSLASVLALVYLFQDHNLKRKRLGLVWERLPALETLDHLMGRQIGIGFLLLTGAILLGTTLVWNSGRGGEWLTDPKIGAAALTWTLFAVLVHMRASSRRHGRRLALMAIAGLMCLLFTFIGVHAVIGSMHGFVRILPAY